MTKPSHLSDDAYLASLSRTTMDGAEAALGFLQAKNIDALRMRTQSRSYAMAQMAHYLQRLNLDVASLPVVHIAGSKGKGSTGAFTETILHQHGLKTGMYTSPHLVSLTERFRIDTKHISDELFLKHFWRVFDGLWHSRPASALPITDSEGSTGSIPPMPAYFAFLTLVGFDLFLLEAVDVLVLEVGLGGKLDATNIVPNPLVTAITPLFLEHTEVLGDTIQLIAAEKAGILKPGAPLLLSPQQPEAAAVVFDSARAVGVTPVTVDPLPAATELGLHGSHQASNAALACGLAAVALDRLSSSRTLPAPRPVPHTLVDRPSLSPRARRRADYTTSLLEAAAKQQLDFRPLAALVSSHADALRRAHPWIALPTTDFTAPAVVEQVASVPRLTLPALPEPFVAGLASTSWAGRCQSVSCADAPNLSFHLDGAHTPDSIQLCDDWFGQLCADDDALASGSNASTNTDVDAEVEYVLLFNCGHVRSPFTLMQPLAHPRAHKPFQHVFFAPFDHDRLHLVDPPVLSALVSSSPVPVPDSALALADGVVAARPVIDGPVIEDGSVAAQPLSLSLDQSHPWQAVLMGSWHALDPHDRTLLTLKRSTPAGAQRVDTYCSKGLLGSGAATEVTMASPMTHNPELAIHGNIRVTPAVRDAVSAIKHMARARPTVRFRALVTGSLYLVGNVLKALKINV
jgi:folylpolyglutamate synthase/dihydropteroate synthase